MNALCAIRRPRVSTLAAVVLAVAVLLAEAPAAAFVAQVVSVADGDTLTVIASGRPTRVRLADIDAPEYGQPYGRASRRALAALVAGGQVDVEARGVDRHGRTVAHVRAGGVDVGTAMVRGGFAWVYRAYAHDDRLVAFEREARQARRGLWRDPVPVEPWAWRERHAPQAGERIR